MSKLNGHNKMSKAIDIKKDRENWPLWCPCCGNAAPNDPANNWESTEVGLECVGCGATQRWATAERKREWLTRRRKELGTAFEAWMDMDFWVLHLDLLLQNHFRPLTEHIDGESLPNISPEDNLDELYAKPGANSIAGGIRP